MKRVPYPDHMSREKAREHTVAIVQRLAQFQFTHFVTLTFSNARAGHMYKLGSSIPGEYVRERLRQWDARICSLLLGPQWQKKAPDRPLMAAFLEKPDTSPHYHLLMRFQPFARLTIAEQHHLFEAEASRLWRGVVPGGTVDMKPISTPFTIARYVLKTYGYNMRYETMIWPDELFRKSTVQETQDIGKKAEKLAKAKEDNLDKHSETLLRTVEAYRAER